MTGAPCSDFFRIRQRFQELPVIAFRRVIHRMNSDFRTGAMPTGEFLDASEKELAHERRSDFGDFIDLFLVRLFRRTPFRIFGRLFLVSSRHFQPPAVLSIRRSAFHSACRPSDRVSLI